MSSPEGHRVPQGPSGVVADDLLQGQEPAGDFPDIRWYGPDGAPQPDWEAGVALACRIDGRREHTGADRDDDNLFLIFNNGPSRRHSSCRPTTTAGRGTSLTSQERAPAVRQGAARRDRGRAEPGRLHGALKGTVAFPAENRSPVQPLQRELKYVFPNLRAGWLREWLGVRCRPDGEFAAGRISSIYFDTWSESLLDEKVNSDYQKTKVRLRWYGDWATGAPAGACFSK
jgi:hypothetical protein